MKQKKTPLRMCLGCSEMKPKQELVRVVKNKNGQVLLDTVGRAPGRGAYICKNVECFKIAVKKHRFENAFSSKIPDEIACAIEMELKSEK